MATPTSKRYSPPPSVVGPDGPRLGDYSGLPSTLKPPGSASVPGIRQVTDFLRHKRWMYTFAATREIIVTCAIVDAGPTGTAFLTVADRRTGHMLADISRPGGTRPLMAVNDRPGEGHRSRYRMPGTDVAMHTEDGILYVRARVGSPIGLPAISKPAVELDLAFDITAQPPLTVISGLDTDPPLISTTGKSAAVQVAGSVVVRIGGFRHEFDLRDGLGGFDYTSGMLPRHTQWRWGFLTGRLADGRPVGMNLTSRFTGLEGQSRENSLWLDGRLHALDPDAEITFDTDDPSKPWHVATADGAVELEFLPIGVHRESLDLRLIRSRFLQPVGEFTGTIRIDGELLRVDGLPGVVENQDTLW